jgi:hypothetical protein
MGDYKRKRAGDHKGRALLYMMGRDALISSPYLMVVNVLVVL